MEKKFEEELKVQGKKSGKISIYMKNKIVNYLIYLFDL